MRQIGLVFNVQKYSVQDGPGIRTTVFLKGCPLQCAWCHNPESISPRPEIVIFEARCLGCQECRQACPFGATIPGDGPLPADIESCICCGACVDACATGARQMLGREMTVDQVLEAVLRDRIFYDDSGGGVTFSGGEPLLQFEFLQQVLLACRQQGIHTAVDTCGMVRTDHLLAIAPLTDLFLYDLKFLDEAKHRHYTGASNTLILENLQALGRAHKNIWVRVPVIPGINDSRDEVEAMARFAASVPGVRQVNLLPFHRTGLQKSERLGQVSSVAKLQPPSRESMEMVVDIFRGVGLISFTGG